jgi:DNA-binding sugar fermentation-stimulating protein
MLGRALQLPIELTASVARGAGRRVENLALAGLDAVLASRVAEEAVDRALASRLAEHTVDRVFDQERLIDETVTRLLESAELWVLVDSIAKSPAVTEAIARQSVGFADQVADGVRERTQRLDMRLERAARRIARRPPRPSAESP